MKITKLTIKNIGIIEDVEILINKPELIFYGDIKQGKSTLLNAMRWVWGGSFPNDIIRHGQTEASVTVEGTEQNDTPWFIQREWYVAKDGATKAREIVYTINGKPVKKPVQEIQKHLNPFLLDQDYLRKMTPLERSRYLIELFGVQTALEDAAISAANLEASSLRMKIKMYGAIDLTPVERVDVAKLRAERDAVLQEHRNRTAGAREQIAEARNKYDSIVKEVNDDNDGIRSWNQKIDLAESDAKDVADQIRELEKLLAIAQSKQIKVAMWLKTHQRQELKIRARKNHGVAHHSAG